MRCLDLLLLLFNLTHTLVPPSSDADDYIIIPLIPPAASVAPTHVSAAVSVSAVPRFFNLPEMPLLLVYHWRT
jgi:hypothetical protein